MPPPPPLGLQWKENAKTRHKPLSLDNMLQLVGEVGALPGQDRKAALKIAISPSFTNLRITGQPLQLWFWPTDKAPVVGGRDIHARWGDKNIALQLTCGLSM